MSSISSDIEQLASRLAPETRRQRQAALLRPLNISLIVISLIGLVIMISTRGTLAGTFAVVISSLLINLLVGALDRAGKTGLAAYIFCIWINLGILFLIAVNLLLEDNPAVAYVFACQLALTVLLAGQLFGTWLASIFAAVNVITFFAMLARYFNNHSPSQGTSQIEFVLDNGIPIAAFLVLIAIITSLYQRALRKADERIEVARRRIIQDELTRRDLAIARELQLRLFPPPPMVQPTLKIATRSVAARETSGDFYDFIELGDDMLGIVVADVTGKSVAAALMMALARVTIRSEARRHTAPAEVLRSANETISRDHTTRQMITAFYGVLDTRSLTLRFSNAGHPYPILRRNNRLQEFELGGMPLGGRIDSQYSELIVQLEPGDQLFLLSDGLIEERNRSREMYGYGRLGQAIIAGDPMDPDKTLATLWQSVTTFRGDIEQGDDITLMVIQAAPSGEHGEAPDRSGASGPPTRP
jgi:serine phosphatase RsbU (regulator of sigma subunit)